MQLPARGPSLAHLGLPPSRLAMFRRGRLRQRWRYVAHYSRDLMLCVGAAQIGPIPQCWWAIATPDGKLHQHSAIGKAGVELDGPTVRVDSRGTTIDLTLGQGSPMETASPIGDRGNWIWTRKEADVPVTGTIRFDGREVAIDGIAFIDDSAGYHLRHTVWKWSAGNGRTTDGRAVAWNLVSGVHDSPEHSERTLWIGSEPRELGRLDFADDFSCVAFAEGGALDFTEWSAREERMNALLLRSTYRQPFGTFTGTLPGGLELAEGYGVMEEHDVYW